MRPYHPDSDPLPSTIVDFSTLRSLLGDDEQSIRELLDHYLQSLRALSGELRDCARNGMVLEVGAIAHRLKSSSRSVGARSLGDLCDALERASHARDQEAIRHCLAQFEHAVPAVEHAIAQHLGQVDRHG